MENVRIEESGDRNMDQNLSVRIDRKPDALIFKEKERGTLTATICASCGQTELRCDNLPALWGAYCATRGRTGRSSR